METESIRSNNISESMIHGLLSEDSVHACLEISGTDRVDLLHRLSTNDLLTQSAGAVIPASFLNEKGRMVDYAQIIFSSDSIIALVSAGNESAFTEWIDRFTIMEDVKVRPLEDELAAIPLMGPGAIDSLVQSYGSVPEPGRYISVNDPGGKVMICRLDGFGNDRFELLTPKASRNAVVERLLTTSKLRRGGKDVWDLARILRGVPRLGHEISEQFNPHEIRIIHSISFTKGCYIGQEVVARLDTYDKVQKQLSGLVFHQAGSDRPQTKMVRHQGVEIGEVTSISQVLFNGSLPALAILKKGSPVPGSIVSVGEMKGEVCDLPIDRFIAARFPGQNPGKGKNSK